MAKIDPMYHLVNTIFDHKEVVIFLGGGASKEGTRGDSNFPDSEQLMKEVVADYGITPKSKTELRNYFFEIIKNWEDEKKLGVRLRKYLDGDPGAAHYYLAALSIALYGESNALLYLTTTFDDLMERAFTDVIKNSIRRFRPISLSIRPQMTGSECHTIANAIEGNLKTGQPVIVKLFGDLISGPQILRRNEMNFPPEMEATLIRWMSKPMIAIGYRFSDKSLKNLLMASRGTAPVFIVNPSKMIPSVIKNMDRVNHIKKDFSGFMAELLTLLGEKNWKPTEKIEEILNTLQQFPALPGLKKKENNTNTKPFEILEEEGKSKGHLFFPEISIGEKPVKILILSANPQETTRIRTDEEVREIDSVLRRSANHNLFKIKVRLAVRFLDIRDALLDEKPHLVHFIGHSRSNGLMVEDEIGNAKNIQPDVLARIFEMSQGHILCVFLGACYTKELATAISNHIDFVIGNPGKISDHDAIKFSVAFYEALGAGKDYETAFKFGLSALKYLNASSLPVFFKKKKHVTLAIRSFHHFNDDLENEADYILDLCNRFDKRKLVTGTWEDIKRDTINFIRNKAKSMVRCDFHLPLHSALVFLTGREFPFKSGIEANVFQYSPKRKLWRIPKNVDWERVEKWIVETQVLNSTGNELVVALSLTHDVGAEVHAFIKRKLPNVSHFIHLRLKHPNHKAIENSSQAYGLSVRAIQEIRNQKAYFNSSRLHLFLAAPNIFTFRLGQNSTQLTNMTLYDYDAENGGYTKTYSITGESSDEFLEPKAEDIKVSSEDEMFLEEFYSVIEKNFDNPDFTIDILCENLYMGRSTLFKKVKTLTGITPTVHIIRIRLDHAAQLIRDNYGSIADVALAVGFSNTAYFSKCFSDQFGMSPSQYQKAKLEEKKIDEADEEKEQAVDVEKSPQAIISPFDLSIEDLDQELIARGKQMARDKGISFPDIAGTKEGDGIIKRLKELYDLDAPSKLRDELRHVRTEDLVKVLMSRTGQIELPGTNGSWGNDGPLDYYEIEHPLVKENADCTGAIFMAQDMRSIGDGQITLNLMNYGATYNLCPHERFFEQPVAGGPMATCVLVKDDVIAAAAHFAHNRNVRDLRIIFNYKLTNEAQGLEIPLSSDKVYKCTEILHRVYRPENDLSDWALVKLDRKVTNGRVATLSKHNVRIDQPVYTIGYPVGLPLKYTPGGTVRDIKEMFFAADLDVYSGNSGSPVFCAETHEVIGMVSRGKDKDFRWTGKCWTTIAYPKYDEQAWARCTRVSSFREDVLRLENESQPEETEIPVSITGSYLKALELEKELRDAISKGIKEDGKTLLEDIIKLVPEHEEPLKKEFGYFLHSDSPERNEKTDWRRKIWKLFAKKNLFFNEMVERFNETPVEEVIEDQHPDKETGPMSVANDQREGKAPVELGEELEVPVLDLFRKFLAMCNEDFATDIIDKKRRQPSGFQFGYDLEFACEIEGEKKLKLRIECKNYTGKLNLGDLTGKLATVKLDQENDPIDHWIVIAPFASIPVDLNRCLNSWETTNEYPFKVQVWNQTDHFVDRFFALVPDIYDRFFKPMEGRKHPRDWSQEEKNDNLEFWKKKLEPPLRLPTGWQAYLDPDKPAKLKLDLKECEFEKKYKTDSYVDMNCRDVTGAILPHPLEQKVYAWLKEPVAKNPVLFLLGEFGDGKTFFTYVLTRKLVEQFRESPRNGWIPVRFALKNIGKHFDPEHPKHIQDFIQYRLNEFGSHIEGWNELRNEGFNILVILDGFDEISKELDPKTIQRNIDILIELYKSDYFSGVKMLITSRKHFFENHKEKDWLLDKLRTPQLLHLAPISRNTAEEYLREYAVGIGQEEKFEKIKKCHDPIGLAAKPLFLEMVEVSLKDLPEKDLNEFILYETYIKKSLKRKEDLLHDRRKETPRELIRENLLKGLELVALELHQSEEKDEFVYLSEIIERSDLREWLWTLSKPDDTSKEDEKGRIATRSLLERVDVTNQPKDKEWPVDFCHRSIREYFVARAVCHMLENDLKKAEGFLKGHFLGHEILFFAGEIMKQGNCEYEAHLLALIEKTRNVKGQARLQLGYLGGNAVNLLYQYKGKLPTDFDWSNLILDSAILPDADLSGRDFRKTSLQYANLDNVNFSGADFTGCNLTEVRIEETAPVQGIAVSAGENILALYNDGVIRQWIYMADKRPTAVNLPGCIEEKDMTLITQPGNDLTVIHDKYLYFYDREENQFIQKAQIEMNTDLQLIKTDRDFLLLKESTAERNRLHLVDLNQSALLKSIPCPPFSLCDHLGTHAIVTYNETVGLQLIDISAVGRSPLTITTTEKISCLAACQCRERENFYLLGLGLFNGSLQIWQVDVTEWNAEKRTEKQLHQEKSHVKDIAFIDAGRVVTGGADKTIKLLTFNNDGQPAGKAEEFKMTLQCSGMKLDGVIRETIEGKKLRELRDKADQLTSETTTG